PFRDQPAGLRQRHQEVRRERLLTATRKVFLLGERISYSRSPAMHNAAFEHLGMDWRYELLDLPRDQLAATVRHLRTPDVGGANVTMPYKQVVMEHLDSVAPEAIRARAVNTIVNEGGK